MKLLRTIVLASLASTLLAQAADTKPIALPKPPPPATIEHCTYTQKYSTRTQKHYYVKHCNKTKDFDQKVTDFLHELTPTQTSALQKRINEQKKTVHNPFAVSFYQPNYVLPYYYTGNPYQSIYVGHTPENQRVMNSEFKYQMSFQVALWPHMFHSKLNLVFAYTQLSYWQFYAKSQYFRETNYEGSVFFSDNFTENWLGSIGVEHQSNGRGGPLERSWNRLFANLVLSGNHWLIDLDPWILIFTQESSDLHNPDICKYLGYGREIFAFTFYHQEITFQFRNILESGFKRGTIIAGYSFPIYGKMKGYIQFFTGYGQSLIEYNHYTNSAGIGIVFSNWI